MKKVEKIEDVINENKKLKKLYQQQQHLIKQLQTKNRILKYDKDQLTTKLNGLLRKKE